MIKEDSLLSDTFYLPWADYLAGTTFPGMKSIFPSSISQSLENQQSLVICNGITCHNHICRNCAETD